MSSMSKSQRYRVAFKRRREGRTDYRQRRGLLASGLPRLSVRGSLNHCRVEVVEAKAEGDFILASSSSEDLVHHYGWKGHTGNIPAAYLTGLLAGIRAKDKHVEKMVLDIGLHQPRKGARIFAALKGALDAGIDIPHSEDVLPKEERIKGTSTTSYWKRLSTEDPANAQRRFSGYAKRGLTIEQLPEHFESVKQSIMNKGGGV